MDPWGSEETPEALFASRDRAEARDKLAEVYLPLAETLARRYQYSGQAIEDLVQIASIGLLKAIDRFDTKRGVNFESYAVPTIVGELKRHHRDRGWCIRVPRRLQEHALAVKGAIPELAQELGRSPTIREVASFTGMSEDDVLDAIEAQEAYSSMSLDAPLTNDTGDSMTLGDVIPGDFGDELEMIEEWSVCLPHLRALPERERQLIDLRYFKERTQSEIAAELGISQMHVSRLLAQTLEALREAVGAA